MRNQFAIAGIACIGLLALGGTASAQLQKYLEKPLPIDERTLTPPAQSRYFSAAQLRCTMRNPKGEPAVFNFVFADPSGKAPSYKLVMEDGETGPILNQRVEGGERRFSVSAKVGTVDFVVKADGSISLTQVNGKAPPMTLEGGCDVVTAAAEPELPPPTVLNAKALVCTLRWKGQERRIEVLFAGPNGFSFFEPASREGWKGDVANDSQVSDHRNFWLTFKDGRRSMLSVHFELMADGRLTALRARAFDRDGHPSQWGQIDMPGSCQVKA